MKLEGDRVTLASFRAALDQFDQAIREAIGPTRRDRVDVVVETLSSGSAYVTAALEFTNDRDEAAVADRVYAFAAAAQQHDTSKVSQRMAHHVEEFHRILGHPDVISLYFATSEHDFFVQPAERADVGSLPSSEPATGEVRGRIETIARRSRRFLLYDLLHDTPVTCYLPVDAEERIRGLWGKLAAVSGTVVRDPVTDRPASVRGITRIEEIPEGDPDGWRRVIGALPVSPNVAFDLDRYLDEASE